MYKKNLVLLLIIMFCSIILISSLEYMPNQKQNQIVTITQSCINATYINITSISYPNSSIAVSNIIMISNNNSEFYYDFDKTSQLGRYDIRGISDGCEETFTTYFFVESATATNTLQGTLLIIFLLTLFTGLTYLSFNLTKTDKTLDNENLSKLKLENVMGYYMNISSKNLFIVGYFGMYICVLMFITILYVALDSMGLSEFAKIVYYLIVIIGWGIIPFLIFWLIWFTVFLYKTNEKILDYQFGGFRREAHR